VPPPQHPGLRRRIAALRQHASHSAHDNGVREVVRLRSNDACEYCLLPTTSKFEIEHIIPRNRWTTYQTNQLPGVRPRLDRHGPDHIDNYAWACPFCNRAKADRVSHRIERKPIRFFDPRHDSWPAHFVFAPASAYVVILGATSVGSVTAGPRGLGFNRGGPEGPMVTRHVEVLNGSYPPMWARAAYDI